MFVLVPVVALCVTVSTLAGALSDPLRNTEGGDELTAEPTVQEADAPGSETTAEELAAGVDSSGAMEAVEAVVVAAATDEDPCGMVGPWPGSPGASTAPWESTVSTALHAPAALLLALTLAATAALPSLRATPHARALACHAAALLAATLVQLWWSLRRDPPDGECYAALLTYQFSYLSAYFWLNAMCVDMYLAFRHLTGAEVGQRQRFLAYSLYAWGCPAAVAAATAAVQFSGSIHDVLLPFNSDGCFFKSNEGLFLYLYGPVVALLLVNLLLFALTATRIHQLHRDTAILDPEERGTTLCSQERAILYVRLLWSMGVIEMVVELVSWDQGRGPMSLCIRSVVDLCRAVSVFAVSCCRRNVLRGLLALRSGSSRSGTGSCAPTRQNSVLPRRGPQSLQNTIARLPVPGEPPAKY